MKTFSLVIPVYNEEEVLNHTLKTITKVLKPLTKKYHIELIFVDDYSTDKSWDMLNGFSYGKAYSIKLIRHSKNFGSHIGIVTGFSKASGDVMGIITADLQDPPELIPQMLEKWSEGYKVVLAHRAEREDGVLNDLLARIYHFLIKRHVLPDMPDGGFDFFVLDRSVADILVRMDEKHSSLFCQIIWLGFDKYLIPYKRGKRIGGKSKFTLKKKIKLVVDSFVSFSFIPFQILRNVGFLLSLLGIVYAGFIVYRHFHSPTAVEGWSSLMVVFLIVSGFLFVMLGVMGEYICRILEETRKRPTAIIDTYREK